MTYEALGSHMHIIGPWLDAHKELPGDIAEFGVYAGATTVQLAQFGRCVWAFDTFTGIPKEHYTEGLDRDEPGKFDVDLEVYETLLRSPRIIPIAGRIEQSLPDVCDSFLNPLKLACVYLDCDLYKTTAFILNWLPNHLVPGAAIFLDDYHTHPGIQRAVTEFLTNCPQATFNGSETILWP